MRPSNTKPQDGGKTAERHIHTQHTTHTNAH